MTDSELLTTSQVAERTGYSARTIARWASTGRLKAAQQLRQGDYLFSEDELKKLPRKIAPETAA